MGVTNLANAPVQPFVSHIRVWLASFSPPSSHKRSLFS